MNLPTRFDMGMTRNWTVDTLLRNRGEGDKAQKFYEDELPWLMGYRIPTWQRDLVWTEAQKIKFIETMILGLPLGTFVTNASDASKKVGDRTFFHKTDRLLIDGQQRLNALNDYFGDAFPVFGVVWSEVDGNDRWRILNSPFPAFEMRTSDENVLREVYDRLNYGGTAHTFEERATREDEQILPTSPGMR